MAHKFALKHKIDGTVFEHPDLIQRRYFATIDAVLNYIKSVPARTYIVIDSLGQELPHFFNDLPMYAVRHKTGTLYQPPIGSSWNTTKAVVLRAFRTDPRRSEEGYKELLNEDRWYVCDQFLREVRTDRERFITIPQEPGLWALLIQNGPHKALAKRSNGLCWFASLSGLKRFVANDSSFIKVKTVGIRTQARVRQGLTVIRSLGNGEYEKLPEIDLFL
ncbi:MAG: hypothetical protein KAS32_25575 [Candidatus Peribacteraceae bacterium]|nr:hypothetical protein [Candidatus Peribacteraceae bacterium]